MGTAINPNDIKRYETTEVYSHPDAKVDIVLVHGLNGNPLKTWQAKNGIFWPTDLLPVSLKSVKARILVYGYNADVWSFSGGKSASSDMIYQHAQSLVSNLALERKNEEVSDHPIIWVAHSLGGILVKRALELSNDLTSKNADDNRSIFVATYGIIFLGTPHTGADAAKWGLILQGMVDALVPKKFMDTDAQLVKTLQTNNETLQNINLHFLDIYQRFRICMAHEAVKTDFKGTRAFVVDQASASPFLPDVEYFAIEATHSGMCKFESKNSPGYLNVSTAIKGWVQECPPVIQARLDMERRQRRQMKEAQAAELLNIYPSTMGTPQASTSGQTPEPHSVNNSTIIVKSTMSIEPETSDEAPYFIKPTGFRPNSLFVGRDTELAELHRMLFDKKKRAEGTSAVLIQSMPGGGKTHLARQYVYEHKSDFPGGIFWIRAKSITELAAGFWDIARKAALKPSMSDEDTRSLDHPQQFIRLVRKWFNGRRNWLLVLDGIHFDDMEGLRRFIPDAVSTSLVYTSTEKSVSNDYHFMNPQIIKLPLLSAREAQQLLLLEMDRKEPFSKDDLKHSMELVQAMGLLPVVIHTMAQRLKATDEPLAKFARSYASEPKLRGLGAFVSVVDQLKVLGAYEALNLMYILCFFGQHIPVDMISFGLKALDVPVKASEPVTGRSMDNTFRILNTFALMERNAHVTSMNSSQSSKSSRDVLTENIDVVRLHSVVQGFFVDTLLANGTLPMWLARAIQVFCCSYDTANARIVRKVYAGLVEDYRLYEIHGIRLREHVVKALKHERKNDIFENLKVTQHILETRLTAIQNEIDRRTPESSHVIADGRPDAFQTSIFDRTSSSSDTGPETPGKNSRSNSKFYSGISAWGLETTKPRHESPTSIHYDTGDEEFDIERLRHLDYTTRHLFPPLPAQEDAGYESDREGSAAMTYQPSQRTIRPGSPKSSLNEQRELVPPHKRTLKTRRLDHSPHRTIRAMDKRKYRDRAGSYRSVTAIDPRVSHDFATGFFPTIPPRGRDHDQISGKSTAEVSLAHISKTSPPPARGGGMVRDRSSSFRGQERPSRMLTGLASAAAAVAGLKRDSVPELKERPVAEPRMVGSMNEPRRERPRSSAMESLQKISLESGRPQHESEQPAVFTPMPPYPPSPALSYRHPYPYTYLATDNHLYSPSNQHNDENVDPASADPPMNHYTNQHGQISIRSQATPLLASRPLPYSKRKPPLDYATFDPQIYSESLPTTPFMVPATHATKSFPPDADHLSHSLSSLAPVRSRHDATYYPGYPEFSNSQNHGGYSSQPMSRGRSSEVPENTTGRRRPSMAESEPVVKLPMFEPRVGMGETSYEVWERENRDDIEEGERLKVEREQERRRDISLARKSPRLVMARAMASAERRNESVPPRRAFNPAAVPFHPSRTAPLLSTPTFPSLRPPRSPLLPPVPQNSTLSNNNTSPLPSPPFFPATTGLLPATPDPTDVELTFEEAFSHEESRLRNSRGRPEQSPDQAPEMARSGSGGMKWGRRVIAFGDFPESVGVEEARERAARVWREREGEKVGLGIQ